MNRFIERHIMKYILLVLLIVFSVGCKKGIDCSAAERIKATGQSCEWRCAQRQCCCNKEMLNLCVDACKAENVYLFKAVCRRP